MQIKVAPEERFPELDSLRGLAAVVVVLHHFKLMFYRDALTTGLPSLIAYPFTAGHDGFCASTDRTSQLFSCR